MAYFIKVGTESWIELNTLDFNVYSPVDSKNKFAQPGPPEFGSLNVSLANEALLPSLIGKSVDGSPENVIIRAADSLVTQPLYDLVLSGAVIAALADDMVGGPDLQIAYGEIAINTYTVDNTGKSLLDGSFDWDVTTNDGTPENIPVLPDINDINKNKAFAASPAKFVMAIDGVGGDSNVAGHAGWFDITRFSYDFSREYNGSSYLTGVNNGFSVTVSSQTALTALMNLAANDSLIDAVEIEGLSSGDILTTETLFGNVRIVSITEDADNGYSVNFSYNVISSDLFDTTGTTIDRHYDFDFLINQSGTDITVPTPGSSLKTAAPVQYFLALTGFAGDSANSAHERWFNLDSIDFALDASGTLPDIGNVELLLSSDTEIADIMARLVSGKAISAATVRGINDTGDIVYTLDMGNVTVAGLADRIDGGALLGLDFQKMELSTRGYDGANVLKNNPNFGWDFGTGTALGSLASATPAKVSNTTVAAEKYYMIVDGMNGGSIAAGHERWFELTSFDFGAFRDGSNFDFDNVTVEMDGDMGLTAMIRAATMGSAIKGIRIVGVNDVSGTEKTVYQLALTDVQVQSVDDTGAPGYSAVFDYGKFALRTFDGITGAQTGVTGWDLVADTNYTLAPALKTSFGFAEGQATRFVFGAPELAGDSALRNFKGFSDIVDFSFGVSQPTSDGASAGDSQLNRLTLYFSSDTALPGLLQLAATGTLIPVASLKGMTNVAVKALEQTVFAIDLEEVMVTAVNDTAGGGFTADFDFSKFEISQTRINPATGALGTKNEFGWDDSLDMETAVKAAAPGTKNEAVKPTTHYMAIDGFHGDLDGAVRGGWLQLADVTFNGSNTGEVGNGSASGGSGTFHLDSITFSMASDAGMTKLLDYMTTGAPVPGIQIEGTALNAGGAERTVQIYSLGEAYVTSVTDREGPGYFVTVEAARFSLENFQLKGAAAGQTIGLAQWDLETDTSTFSGPAASPGGTAGNDVIAGNRSNNTIDGLAGGDTIYGYDGTDTLLGSDGNDKLFGGNGDDTLSAGNNVDLLAGGAGKDTLTGGSGKDVFRYSAASDSTADASRDIITDFEFGQDGINLAGVTSPGSQFIDGGGAFTGTNQVRVIASGGDAVVQVNMSGDTTPEMEILVQNRNFLTFSIADFVIS